jgi:hydroxymethylpyrimidine/phosphomethylpyrimidine kinase
VILTIAGFDPSSGAGITADLKTIAAHEAYGMAAITAITVQSTEGVKRVEPVSAKLLRETLDALAADTEFAAIKIGMLGSGEIASVVGGFLNSQREVPIVLDSIIRSSSGATMLDESGIAILREELLPRATVITPNIYEAEVLAGKPVTNLEQASEAAEGLRRMGARNVVITGGHLPGNTDVLLRESGEFLEFAGPKIESKATHGTGCAFSTAIACGLAQGKNLPDAVRMAKEYVSQAIENAYPVGKGTGPLNHLFRLK